MVLTVGSAGVLIESRPCIQFTGAEGVNKSNRDERAAYGMRRIPAGTL